MSSMFVPSRLKRVSVRVRANECRRRYSRNVLDSSGLDGRYNFLRELYSTVSIKLTGDCRPCTHNASDLDSVNASDVAVQALPSGDPARARVGKSDQALEDLAGAFLNGVVVAGQLEELFTVGASLAAEARTRKDDAADHAGAQRAVLRGRHEVGHDDVREGMRQRWKWS